ncbi:hypothetical protein ACFX2I_037695 [Malus domestica]
MEECSEGEDFADLGMRFGAKLSLSEKERDGVTVGRREVDEALLEFHHCLLVEVLTDKGVNRDAFIDCFTSLWRGRKGVSIRELGD